MLKAYSNESSGTIFVLDPQGHQEIRMSVAQGNDTIYTDSAFSDPPYVVLPGGTWHLNASLSEVKSIHVMIYALL